VGFLNKYPNKYNSKGYLRRAVPEFRKDRRLLARVIRRGSQGTGMKVNPPWTLGLESMNT
jgi:hypothetical protein